MTKLFYFCHLKKMVRPETVGPYCVCCNVGNKRRMETFGGKSRRSAGVLELRWKENIEMDFREIFRNGVNCIQLAEDSEKWRVS